MPLGSRHKISGLLLTRHGSLTLEVNGGGVWRLENEPSLAKYLGRRATVEATRTGFDLLSVQRIDVA